MALDRTHGQEPDELSAITGRITITLGLKPETGERGMTFLFEDLMNLDEDGKSQLLGYFEGRMMLGCASDEFYHKHFHDDDDDDDD